MARQLIDDTSTSPEVIDSNTLNLGQILNFHDQEFFGGPHPHLSVRYQRLVNL